MSTDKAGGSAPAEPLTDQHSRFSGVSENVIIMRKRGDLLIGAIETLEDYIQFRQHIGPDEVNLAAAVLNDLRSLRAALATQQAALREQIEEVIRCAGYVDFVVKGEDCGCNTPEGRLLHASSNMSDLLEAIDNLRARLLGVEPGATT